MSIWDSKGEEVTRVNRAKQCWHSRGKDLGTWHGSVWLKQGLKSFAHRAGWAQQRWSTGIAQGVKYLAHRAGHRGLGLWHTKQGWHSREVSPQNRQSTGRVKDSPESPPRQRNTRTAR